MTFPFATTSEPTGIPNIPSLEGSELGRELARLADSEYRRTGRDTRCDDCAFRLGTVPNQCAGTLIDAFKCIVDGITFHCHQTDRPCGGYVAAVMEDSL